MLASVCISRAFWALGALGFGQNPSSAMAQAGLDALYDYLKHVCGVDGGLPPQQVRTASSFTLSTAWPAVRVQAIGGITITLPEGADGDPIADGFRIEVADVSRTAGTSNITIARNGWQINAAAANTTISSNGGVARLFFRAELGDWKSVPTSLALSDHVTGAAGLLPEEFDEFLPKLLALRVQGGIGQGLSDTDTAIAGEGARRLRARYRKPPRAVFDSAVSAIGARFCGAIEDPYGG